MTKSELLKALHLETGLTQQDADKFLNGLSEVLQNKLCARWDVILPNIGKFSSQRREARKGHNPKTGEAMTIPAKTVIKFKAVKSLRDAVQA